MFPVHIGLWAVLALIYGLGIGLWALYFLFHYSPKKKKRMIFRQAQQEEEVKFYRNLKNTSEFTTYTQD